MSVENPRVMRKQPKAKTLADKWILSKLEAIESSVTKDLDKYAFSKSADDLRHFTWDDLADWYVEIAKIEGDKDDILLYILYRLLILWHPFTPYITEVIWENIKTKEDEMLLIQPWPAQKKKIMIPEDFTILQDCIKNIRYLKNTYSISPKTLIPAVITTTENEELFSKHKEIIEKLSRVKIESVSKKVFIVKEPVLYFSVIGKSTRLVTVNLRVKGILDIVKERNRLNAEVKKLEKYRLKLVKKLDSEAFSKNAPKEVVKAERQKLHDAGTKITNYRIQLDSLK